MSLPEDCARSFELEGVLGQGGFGTVYRCRHRGLKSPAAVKVMRRELAGADEQVQRFIREARVMAALKHPHIVGVLDAGAVTDPWIAFELISGSSLESRLERGPLSIPEVLELGVHLASALEQAHAHGIVHRDVKPANVLQATTGWKLADFGIAHTDVGRTLTEAGTLLGTPAYMDPLYVQSGEASPQNDLYSLGALIYEAICGVRPIPGEMPMELVQNAIRVVPVRASQHAPHVPPRLERLLARMLAKTAAERPDSARAVGLELEALRGGPPPSPARTVQARPPPARARRRPVLAGCAALAVAGLLVALRPRPDPRVEVTPVPAKLADPSPALLQSIAAIHGRLISLKKAYRHERVAGPVGPEVVMNPRELEPHIAIEARRLLALTAEARASRAPLRVWAWLADLIYQCCEAVRYFPVPPRDDGTLAPLLRQFTRGFVDDGEVLRPLVQAAVACALREKLAERATADGCEAVHARLLESTAGWTDPGERAAFLVALTWRQVNHARRAGESAEYLERLARRICEHGSLLADAGSRGQVPHGGVRSALDNALGRARELKDEKLARRFQDALARFPQ